MNPARRSFFKGMGQVGLTATAALLFGDAPILNAQSTGSNQDSANEILTAALIAEDLATVFYYQGLTTNAVIQDPSLAGPGGSATSGTGNVPNVTYLRAAMAQEIQHATLLRAVGNISTGPTNDPYTTFYFPASTFQNLTNFIATLEELENAFIGAYLNAVREFASLSSRSAVRNVPPGQFGASAYSSAQLSYYSQVAAAIMGVECEHRVLGTVITNTSQPNDRYYEQTADLNAVYHGSRSAVAALTPFLTPTTGPGFSLLTALGAATTIGVSSKGNPPAV